MKKYILYSQKTSITGGQIKRMLGIPGGITPPNGRVDVLIRYGSTKPVKYIPAVQTINYKKSVEKAANKLKMLQFLQTAGINTPLFTADPGFLEPPFIGRQKNHTQGKDINLILQHRDLIKDSSYFFVNYISKKREFRAHVFDGEVIKLNEKKIQRGEIEYNPVIWNYETGFVFGTAEDGPTTAEVKRLAIEAVDALNLHFGAADIIQGEDGEIYILEVNTGPGLSDINMDIFVSKIKSYMEGA